MRRDSSSIQLLRRRSRSRRDSSAVSSALASAESPLSEIERTNAPGKTLWDNAMLTALGTCMNGLKPVDKTSHAVWQSTRCLLK